MIPSVQMSQFQIPHPRLTPLARLPTPSPVHTCCSSVCKRECQLGCISITFKNKGSLWVCRSPDVCILPPRYAKVIRQKKTNQEMLQRGPIPHVVRKSFIQLSVFLLCSKEQRKREEQSRADYLQLISQKQWGIT